MRRFLLGLSLICGMAAQVDAFDFVRSYITNKLNTPKSRALGSLVAGGGAAIVLGGLGFPSLALAAVVCGGWGSNYLRVQGLEERVKAIREGAQDVRHELAKVQGTVGQNGSKISEIDTSLGGIDCKLNEIVSGVTAQKTQIDGLSLQVQIDHASHLERIRLHNNGTGMLQADLESQMNERQVLKERLEKQQKTVESLIEDGSKLSEEQKQQLEEMSLLNNQIVQLMQNGLLGSRRHSDSGESDISSTSISSGSSSVRPSVRLVRDARDGVNSISSAQMLLWSVGIRATPLNSPGFADAGAASPRSEFQRAAEQAQGKWPKSSRH